MTNAMPSVAGKPAEPRFVVMLVYPGVVAMDVFGRSRPSPRPMPSPTDRSIGWPSPA